MMTTSPSGFCRSEPTLRHIRRDADRAGKALADLLPQHPFDLQREFARNLDLALASHQPAGHLVDGHDLLDRQAGVDGRKNALVILGIEPVIGLHRDDAGAQARASRRMVPVLIPNALAA